MLFVVEVYIFILPKNISPLLHSLKLSYSVNVFPEIHYQNLHTTTTPAVAEGKKNRAWGRFELPSFELRALQAHHIIL